MMLPRGSVYARNMGQYYKAVNMDDMEHVSSYTYDNGAKLMEHSYIGNNFVEAVEFLLIEDGDTKGRWSGKRLVWAGDYADDEKDSDENLYSMLEGRGLQMLIEAIPEQFCYLVNHDTQEYVNKCECPKFGEDNDWQIDPLPLLIAEGNGRGGGDYHGDNQELVGSWSRCRIALMKEIPKGYKELKPNFVEWR